MSGKKYINPNNVSLCVLLARGDHAAGLLLDRINYWSKYGKAEIKGVEGHWIANDRPWWQREAQLSLRQYNLAAAKLVKLGLIEKCQSPFAGKNILHVRLSALTKDFLASATTWDVALAVSPQVGIPIPAWLEPGTQVSPSLQEMIDAWSGKESLSPEEVGKLAAYRQGMKSVFVPDEGEHDLSKDTLPLIEWVTHNWTKFLIGCKEFGKSTKDASEPSVAFFCERFDIALTLAWQEHKTNEPSQSGPGPVAGVVGIGLA